MIKAVSISDPELAVYTKLNENQLRRYYEPHGGLFIAESRKVIGRAMDAGYEPVSMLAEKRVMEAGAEEIFSRCGDIPIYVGEYEDLASLTGYSLTGGMLCAMRRKRLPDVHEICAGCLGAPGRIAVLENVQNPTNVGAIFRSAAAMGMDAVLLSPGCSDPLYRRCARVSMGTVFQVPWTFFPMGDWMTILREMGYRTAAMALKQNTISIADPRLKSVRNLALLLGSEGDGLEEETIAASDYVVKIPMALGVDSLNVAAASAVAFWELGMKGRGWEGQDENADRAL